MTIRRLAGWLLVAVVAMPLPASNLGAVSDHRSGRSVLRAAHAWRPPRPALSTPQAEPTDRSPESTLVVKFRVGTAETRRMDALRSVGATAVRSVLGRQVIRVKDRVRARRELARKPDVVSVERDEIRRAFGDPNDPRFPEQTNLLVSRLPAAWDLAHGDPSIDIAIIDSGVDLDAPDLAGRLVPGYDFVNADADPMDDEGHGTRVAGVAAADTDNGKGIAGAAWNARIMPVKVLDDLGAGTDSSIAAGITWAVDHGADVINLSLGGPEPSALLAEAVAYADTHDVVVVAAAGNRGTEQPMYPAAYESVIAVGYTDLAGNVAPDSNRGSWVDVAAPGEALTTHFHNENEESYFVSNATSYAAPVVAGVAAMMRGRFPSMSDGDIARKLRETAADRGPDGIDIFTGHGVLDAYAALGGRTAASPPIAAQDAREPNDVAARAVPANGSTSTIAPEGDVDWFSVEAPGPGRISFEVAPSGQSGANLGFDPIVTAFDDNLALIARRDVGEWAEAEHLDVPVRTAGRFSFEVRNALSSAGARYTATGVFTSAPPQAFLPYEVYPTGSSQEAIATGDVTGDGRSDVVMTTAFLFSELWDYKLVVFPQLPDGSLGPPRKYETHIRYADKAGVDVGDLDGDGDDDVAVATTDGVDVFTQEGGELSAPTLLDSAPAASLVELFDIDGDQDLDMVVGTGGGVRVLKRGASGWSSTLIYDSDVGGLEVGDISGDGRPDVVGTWLGASGWLRVLTQQPNGSFTSSDLDCGLSYRCTFSDVEIADLDGDGRLDVAGAGGSEIWVFTQDEGGHLGHPTNYRTETSLKALEADDVSGDGLADLVATHAGYKNLSVLAQQVAGGFSAPALYEVPYDGAARNQKSLTLDDVSGDGVTDVVLAQANYGAVVLRGVSTHSDQLLWIRSSSPPDFATGVAPGVSPTITFVRNIGEGSVENGGVRLVDAETGGAVPATVSHDASSGTTTIDPTQPLARGKPYEIVATGVFDAQGQQIPEPHRSRFTVGAPTMPPIHDADVNGDGYDDVIVGAPGEDLGSVADAGAVHVFFGGPDGAKTAGSTIVTQDSGGIADVAERGDAFGEAIATGDVNGDGKDDVLIGAPGEDAGATRDVGAVHVLFGSSSGLTAVGAQLWTPASSGGSNSAAARFGEAITTGRFDGVTGNDVAIGAPGTSVDGIARAGVVHVLRGSDGGLVATGEIWSQASDGVDRGIDVGDGFGWSVAAGDFEGDGNDELAIGAPGDESSADAAETNEGSVTVLRGSVAGLRPSGTIDDALDPDGGVEPGDSFGSSVAIADLGGFAPYDAYADLAVGVPGGGGQVRVLFSDVAGPGLDVQHLTPQTAGVPSNAGFGAKIAAARTAGGAGSALIAGAALEPVGALPAAGAVHAFRGGATQLALGTFGVGEHRVLTQDTPGMPGSAEAGERFGAAIAVSDVDGDGSVDALVGTPNEALGAKKDAGGVHVVRHPFAAVPRAQMLTQDSLSVPGTAEIGDRFGAALRENCIFGGCR